MLALEAGFESRPTGLSVAIPVTPLKGAGGCEPSLTPCSGPTARHQLSPGPHCQVELFLPQACSVSAACRGPCRGPIALQLLAHRLHRSLAQMHLSLSNCGSVFAKIAWLGLGGFLDFWLGWRGVCPVRSSGPEGKAPGSCPV